MTSPPQIWAGVEVKIEEEDAALHFGRPVGVEAAVLGVGVGVEKEAAAVLEVDLDEQASLVAPPSLACTSALFLRRRKKP
jgi:hypothetical protein